jgi:hypothetical protein
MDQVPIIPTRRKSKIPHTHSYPVGAKTISEALFGVPQFDDLTVISGSGINLQGTTDQRSPIVCWKLVTQGRQEFSIVWNQIATSDQPGLSPWTPFPGRSDT